MKKVVVIGGGTGTFTILSGLKKKDLDITAIVTVADSGGSTGRLRDEFGFLPVGDYRMALAALADANGDSNIMRELFLYRFDKGMGLKGHNFGNLLITALSDMYKSDEIAYEHVSKILRVKGKVLPVSRDDVTLVAEYEDGSILIGESFIDEPNSRHDCNKKIKKLKIQPKAKIYPKAKKAILEADFIILGPGDLYTSLLANMVVSGTAEAIKKSKGKVIFNVNLINKHGQTTNFTAKKYVDELKRYLKIYPDYVVVSNTKLPQDILKKYEDEKGYPVKNDLNGKHPFKVVKADLLAGKVVVRKEGDAVRRSLIRHDSDKLANVLMKIIGK